MASRHELDLDVDLTPDEERLAAMLTQAQLAEIDAALLRACSPRSRKLAMVIATAMHDLPQRIDGLPDVFYAKRVSAMVASGKLAAIGDLRRMRYSEVRLVAPDGIGGT
jgi:hypothetical protein